MGKRIGRQTLQFTEEITIRSFATVVGRKEAEGPLGPFMTMSFLTIFLAKNRGRKPSKSCSNML